MLEKVIICLLANCEVHNSLHLIKIFPPQNTLQSLEETLIEKSAPFKLVPVLADKVLDKDDIVWSFISAELVGWCNMYHNTLSLKRLQPYTDPNELYANLNI